MTAISLLGIHLKELKIGTQTDPRMPMFIAALFTIGKRWKQPKCLLTDEWINKTWYTHTTEHYSAILNLTHATTWMNLENTVLSIISQTQKDKYCIIQLT